MAKKATRRKSNTTLILKYAHDALPGIGPALRMLGGAFKGIRPYTDPLALAADAAHAALPRSTSKPALINELRQARKRMLGDPDDPAALAATLEAVDKLIK